MTREISCSAAEHRLPGYLDGALTARHAGELRAHLAKCENCRAELEAYRQISIVVARTERVAPPAELATRIRLSVSEARNRQPWPERIVQWAAVRIENFLAPLALRATGGAATAMLIFAVAGYNLLWGIPLGAVPNDVPINQIQPARLEALAPFSVPAVLESESADALLAEVTVNEHGEAMAYQILSGPDNKNVRRQLDQVVFFSRYRPLISFGRPSSGGRVMLSFSEVRVKG